MTEQLREAIQEILASGAPLLLVLAGCNGAGKTTLFRRVLGDALPFSVPTTSVVL